MFTVFAWYKWRNCTQSRLVLGKLYTIAVFLVFLKTLNMFFFSPFFPPSEWIEKNWTVTLQHIESRARKDENTTEEESWRRRYRHRHYVGFLALKIFETL